MNVFDASLQPQDEQRISALSGWYQLLEDRQQRMDCPDTYHERLLYQADEMDRLGLVTWQEWRDLRLEADKAYLWAVHGGDYRN
ncbi:hypothetical protein [Pseudomonas shirazensis]|uniref:hypothetical protein n=1 Tax=Pseudomonas shirazensis TaxID=2745494 RepID=UPI003D2A3C8C